MYTTHLTRIKVSGAHKLLVLMTSSSGETEGRLVILFHFFRWTPRDAGRGVLARVT